MKKIAIYTNFLKTVNGVNTFEKHFIKALRNKFRITYIYGYDNKGIAKNLDLGVEVIHVDEAEKYDICVYSSIDFSKKIVADRKIQIIHSDISEKYNDFKLRDEIDEVVAVSETVQRILKEKYNINSTLLENFFIEDKKDVLKLVSATRLRNEKGLKRMLHFAEVLKKYKIDFVWFVFTNKEEFPNAVQALESKKNVYVLDSYKDVSYILNMFNYLVQFSDHESYCYSVVEAINAGIPVITTDWDGIEKLVDNKSVQNGIIIERSRFFLDFYMDEIVKKILSKPVFCVERRKNWLVVRSKRSIQSWTNYLKK